MDSVYAIGGYYEDFIKEFYYDEELIFENMLTWEVAYGCLNNFEFAQKIRNDKKIIKCDEFMRILTTCYLVNDIIDNEMIKKYPPYYLTYPKIISDGTFYKLLKYQNEELKIPLCIVALIKNKEDIFLKLDPDAHIITYSFAKQYKREKCFNQQMKKYKECKKFSHNHLFVNKEDPHRSSKNIREVKTELYLKYYTYCNKYMYSSYPDYFDENSAGPLGLDYVNVFGAFLMASIKKVENIKINKNLYNDPIQVAYVYNNIEKFDNETCKIAISKLLLCGKIIDKKIINKYKPYDLTKELTFAYLDLEEMYPSIKEDIEKNKNKYENMINGSRIETYIE